MIIIDTNPHAWASLSSQLAISRAIPNILVFINAHLAINNANQVAVLASHSHRAVWLYPRPPSASEDVEMEEPVPSNLSDPNKYRTFALIENSLLISLRELISSTTVEDIATTTNTQMAGALTLALSYIHRATRNYSETGGSSKTTSAEVEASETATGLQSRILVISVSGDLADQYIPIMNTTFAAQRLRIPIDILKLAGDTVFLQQAAYTTNATYMQARNLEAILQYLMMAFLPDQQARKHLVTPTLEVVDFRAACFCHRRVVDVGFVCSICLSSMFSYLPHGHPLIFHTLFCSPPEGSICLTCGTQLSPGLYGAKPAVVPRRKKKKKKVNGGIDTGSARGTPAPGE